MFYIGLFMAILAIILIKNYDSHTTPTKEQLLSMKKTSKSMIRDINSLIKLNQGNTKIIRVLEERKRILLEIYKKSVKGTKGDTLASLVKLSELYHKEYLELKNN